MLNGRRLKNKFISIVVCIDNCITFTLMTHEEINKVVSANGNYHGINSFEHRDHRAGSTITGDIYGTGRKVNNQRVKTNYRSVMDPSFIDEIREKAAKLMKY